MVRYRRTCSGPSCISWVWAVVQSFLDHAAVLDECGRAASVDQTHPSPPLPWCPGLPQYADPVTDLLDRCGVFRTRLFRESCVFHQGCYVKDLSRLGRDLRKTLILDNSPASYIFHPNNAVSSARSSAG